MSAHVHRINKDKFLAEMEKRGWKLDPLGWVVPGGRRIHQRESDWLASILLAIECECPRNQHKETVEIIKTWANEKMPREFDPLGLALADLCERLLGNQQERIESAETKAPNAS
jgi:hypothetical protein